jgi:hypothetical protein
LVLQKMQAGASPLAPVTYLSRHGDHRRSIKASRTSNRS